jgi:hypothetical protein
MEAHDLYYFEDFKICNTYYIEQMFRLFSTTISTNLNCLFVFSSVCYKWKLIEDITKVYNL